LEIAVKFPLDKQRKDQERSRLDLSLQVSRKNN
jgi:hypothetical protein